MSPKELDAILPKRSETHLPGAERRRPKRLMIESMWKHALHAEWFAAIGTIVIVATVIFLMFHWGQPQ
jgi:hypothetical protein